MRHMIVVSLLFCGTAATGAAIAICVGLLIDRPDVVSGALYYGVRAVAAPAGRGYPPAEFADYLEYLRNDAASVIVGMLARRWARESNGAGDLPADWIDGPVPF